MRNYIVLLFASVMLAACGGGSGGGSSPTGDLSVSITNFTFSLQGEIVAVDEANKTIAVTVPYGTDLTKLVATYAASTGTSVTVDKVSQKSGVTSNNFTTPVIYTIAVGSTEVNYTVTVKCALNSAKKITLFQLAGETGMIDENATDKTISFIFKPGTVVTGLNATFLAPGASTVMVGNTLQESGVTPNDFSDPGNPVKYTVTAEDGTKAIYTVIVAVSLPSDKSISEFKILGVGGTIDPTQSNPIPISVILPYGTNIAVPLVASFSYKGASIKVNGTAQTSGTTPNTFTSPVTYTVTAQDGTSANYLVTVTPIAEHYSAVSGGCVKDNGTGLIWEGKTNDGGLRDMHKTYTNYDNTSQAQKWDGSPFVNPTQAEISAATNTLGYVAAVNEAHLCGYSDWRLPTQTELQGLVLVGMTPTIDAAWFPNTVASYYWTSSPFVGNVGFAMFVHFSVGLVGNGLRTDSYYVRLVR